MNGLGGALVAFGAHGRRRTVAMPSAPSEKPATNGGNVVTFKPAAAERTAMAVKVERKRAELPKRERNAELARWVTDFTSRHGRAPTYPEARETFPGMARSTVRGYLATG